MSEQGVYISNEQLKRIGEALERMRLHREEIQTTEDPVRRRQLWDLYRAAEDEVHAIFPPRPTHL